MPIKLTKLSPSRGKKHTFTLTIAGIEFAPIARLSHTYDNRGKRDKTVARVTDALIAVKPTNIVERDLNPPQPLKPLKLVGKVKTAPVKLIEKFLKKTNAKTPTNPKAGMRATGGYLGSVTGRSSSKKPNKANKPKTFFLGDKQTTHTSKSEARKSRAKAAAKDTSSLDTLDKVTKAITAYHPYQLDVIHAAAVDRGLDPHDMSLLEYKAILTGESNRSGAGGDDDAEYRSYLKAIADRIPGELRPAAKKPKANRKPTVDVAALDSDDEPVPSPASDAAVEESDRLADKASDAIESAKDGGDAYDKDVAQTNTTHAADATVDPLEGPNDDASKEPDEA